VSPSGTLPTNPSFDAVDQGYIFTCLTSQNELLFFIYMNML